MERKSCEVYVAAKFLGWMLHALFTYEQLFVAEFNFN
jgi:hypothetical protein